MRRVMAALLLCCCLLILCPAVLADPAQTPETETGEIPENAAPEEGAPENNAPEEAPAEEPAEAPQPAGPDLSALESETAIRSMEIACTLDSRGRMTVTETVELVIVGSLEEIRFSFPQGAKKAGIDGYWTSSSKENGVKYLTVSNRKGFTGTQTFRLSYTLDGLVSAGEASQILTAPLLSLQDYQIGILTFSVALPQEFGGKPRFSSGYFGSLVEDLMTVSCDGRTVTGAMNEIMRDNDSLTMTLALPESYFAGSYGESKLMPVMTAIILILLALALLYWFRFLKTPPLRVQARTLPPDGVTPGDVPFLLAGGHADFNMLVSHWAVLGYLSFYVNKSGNVVLRRRMSMGNERRAFERKLFDLLFGGETLCDGASLRYKKVGEKAMSVIPRYWGKRLYEKRSGSPVLARGLCCLACALAAFLAMDAVAPEKLHGLFLFVSLIAGFAMGWLMQQACGAYYLNDWLRTGVGAACGLGLLIVGGVGGATLTMLPTVAATAFVGWQTAHGGQRRPHGDEVIGQTLGFRRFLLNATDRHVTQMLRRDPQYFYKILPYAEAMGLGRRFAGLFHDCRLEACQWFDAARGVPTTAGAFYDAYADALDLLNISLRK